MTPLRERMGKTLAVAYASTWISQIANQVFFFAVLKYLSVPAVGLYGLAIAVATIVSYVSDFGLATYLVGELPRARYPFAAVLRVIAVTRLPVIALTSVAWVVWTSASGASASMSWTVALVTLTYLIQLVDVGLVPWFQVHERQNTANILALIVPLSRVLLIGLMMALRQTPTLTTVVAIVLVTQVVGTAGVLYWGHGAGAVSAASGTARNAGYAELLAGFRRRGPLLAVMYAVNVLPSRLDWILVSALISESALANYSLANKLLELAILVSGVWGRTAFPWLSRPDAGEGHVGSRLILMRRLFVVASGLVAVGLFCWSPAAVHWFFADKYADADLAIRLMALWTVVFMWNQYFFYVVLSRHLERAYTVLIAAATVLQVGLDLWLIPRIGITGAAIGMVAMAVAIHAGQIALLTRERLLSWPEVGRIELFAGGSIAALAAPWALGFGPVALTVSGLLVAIGLGTFVVLSSSDRGQLREWLKGRWPALPRA